MPRSRPGRLLAALCVVLVAVVVVQWQHIAPHVARAEGDEPVLLVPLPQTSAADLSFTATLVLQGEFARSLPRTLAVTGGGTVSNLLGSIGEASTGRGSATVDGAGSTWSNTSYMYVGWQGTGTLPSCSASPQCWRGAITGTTGRRSERVPPDKPK